jgi:hypothetical protein
MPFLHFALYQTAGPEASQHLVVFDEAPTTMASLPTVLAYWVLPQLSHHHLAQQSHSLLVEANKLPPTASLLDKGLCTLVAGELPAPTRQERLCLFFEGESLRGNFALLRLRPGGSRWLFGRLQFMPDKFVRGPQVAPTWPTTQTASV